MRVIVAKGLSVRQPWASKIANGDKTVEVRPWRTHYRGPLVIVSTKRPRVAGLPSGMALGMVELIDCRPMRPDDCLAACVETYSPGAWAWVLARPRALRTPVPMKGYLCLWNVEIILGKD